MCVHTRIKYQCFFVWSMGMASNIETFPIVIWRFFGFRGGLPPARLSWAITWLWSMVSCTLTVTQADFSADIHAQRVRAYAYV